MKLPVFVESCHLSFLLQVNAVKSKISTSGWQTQPCHVLGTLRDPAGCLRLGHPPGVSRAENLGFSRGGSARPTRAGRRLDQLLPMVAANPNMSIHGQNVYCKYSYLSNKDVDISVIIGIITV